MWDLVTIWPRRCREVECCWGTESGTSLGNKIEKRIYEYREDSGSDDISNGKGFNSKKIKLIPWLLTYEKVIN